MLLYNGQLDIIVAAALTERSLLAMDWKGSQEYRKAKRKVWKIFKSDSEVAGYVRQVGDFTQVGKRFGACGLWGWDLRLKAKPEHPSGAAGLTQRPRPAKVRLPQSSFPPGKTGVSLYCSRDQSVGIVQQSQGRYPANEVTH